MDYNSDDVESISALVPVGVWNYGLSSFDRTQVLKINWLYDLPKSPWRQQPAQLFRLPERGINTRLGEFTAARKARILQLALRFLC